MEVHRTTSEQVIKSVKSSTRGIYYTGKSFDWKPWHGEPYVSDKYAEVKA